MRDTAGRVARGVPSTSPAPAFGIHAPGTVARSVGSRQSELRTQVSLRGSLPTITSMRFELDALVLDFNDAEIGPISLIGPREVVTGIVTDEIACGVRVRLPLVGARWGVQGLGLPTGEYRLRVGEPAAERVVLQTPAFRSLKHPLFRADVRPEIDGLTVCIAPPLADGERNPIPHRDHRQVYLRRQARPENAVYFESFYGRSASDNPAGIDRALAAARPDVTRYWSVSDGSKPVPDGAVRIVEGSAEWWRVRAEARVYVINDWLRWTFRRRPYQHVLQTWHGTMLKRLALDRPNVSLRKRSAVYRQQARWDALLSQNPYSSDIFRSAYAVQCPIWETGYPRNDVFADPARASAVRAAIGVPEGVRVVLYAPTWRDDRTELVDHLDLVAFAGSLGPDHVLLVRGHSRTLAYGGDLRGNRLIDVTSYPDMADLMLVADVLVTDYSSAMFDFAGTGKPMIFYTPDLEHYGDAVRGFYFDLLSHAPGPVVATPRDLRDAVMGIDGTADLHAPAYAAWKARFIPADDGRAGERVVRRILSEGWLP